MILIRIILNNQFLDHIWLTPLVHTKTMSSIVYRLVGLVRGESLRFLQVANQASAPTLFSRVFILSYIQSNLVPQMSGFTTNEQTNVSGGRRGSFAMIKAFVKDTKRRSVQKIVRLSQKKKDTADDAVDVEFENKKAALKDFTYRVNETRKDLATLQISVGKMSNAFSTVFKEIVELPKEGTIEKDAAMKHQAAVAATNVTGEKLGGVMDSARAAILLKLEELQKIKKLCKEREATKTDLQSYERRLNHFREKNDDLNVEKFSSKLQKAQQQFSSLDSDAREKLQHVENIRGNLIQPDLHNIFESMSMFFAELATACGPQTAGSAYGKSPIGNANAESVLSATESDNILPSKPNTHGDLFDEPDRDSASKKDAVTKSVDRAATFSVGMIVTGVHNFTPQEEDELEFKKGDVLEVVEIIAPGWIMARNKDGVSGMVPETYVTA